VRECNINSSGRLGGDTEQICGACDERVDAEPSLDLNVVASVMAKKKNNLVFSSSRHFSTKIFESIDREPGELDGSQNVTLDISEVEIGSGRRRCGLLGGWVGRAAQQELEWRNLVRMPPKIDTFRTH